MKTDGESGRSRGFAYVTFDAPRARASGVRAFERAGAAGRERGAVQGDAGAGPGAKRLEQAAE